MISNPSQRSRSQNMTRVNKEQKGHRSLRSRLKLLRKERLHEEKKDIYFSGKYTCILIIMHCFQH